VRPKTKYTALVVLMLLAVMQVLPFIPTHDVCQASCCDTAVTCCEAEEYSGCEMAMTSCNMSMFIPLVSAPLIKVESNVQLDVALDQPVSNELSNVEQHVDAPIVMLHKETAPPGNLPLLI